MALNKSMHPRNRYKDKPPDFAYLASKYPEFQQHVQTNLIGRVTLNFKDPEAVRALTCTLLKEDFGLTIQIPLERLIPTVPLRLNYIHWVEDLISDQGACDGPRRGIDIGTGASCIYPLLGATMNGWYFLATEVDDICFNYATKNVEQNNLSDLIKVVKVPQKTLLMDALKEESSIIYDFCMCNPPFFANQLEAKGVNSRNARRPPPSSVNTGGETEIMAEGGELEFVKRIIHDSLQLKRRLRWYSCMLGKKCSLAPLKEELRKQGVTKVTHTEFYQGRTMRWALAWSFYDDVSVPSPPSKKRKMEKARKPLAFTILQPTVRELQIKASSLPSSSTSSSSSTACSESSDVHTVTVWMEKTLKDLRILHKRVPSGEAELSLFLTAVENTWVHMRQRRREQNRQQNESLSPGAAVPSAAAQGSDTQPTAAAHETEKQQGPQPSGEVCQSAPAGEQDRNGHHSGAQAGELGEQGPLDVSMESPNTQEEAPVTPEVSHSSQDVEVEAPPGPKEATAGAGAAGSQPQSPGLVQSFLFKSLLNVKVQGADVLVEMHFVEGQNKDLMNQLCTCLKNTLLRTASSPL
ncbi:RNA N6-adenosine-methyltransferase mettl16 [Alosa sapidissima]|uniref:RNA N6-adenosine-methyltransferase mettl16 n=1 Tax=Alosa sapidissima TaxID=34773 RepID=UPI001C0A6268|nr:RNA N6-adenosine-methyltransferase mettl16 [Alosa sapidissima]XP_041919859.1 RNA N6-adenosine-methyltransferase mettl16 [Alosa sapidissima]XP_041919860.1 RNA N6-adenosine-methyltransferase mettl16 [Alosa sapidissima]XP_041919861.1 RNA N6-adenosine-methyltransferase mettl16 [Alosa sapidissima]XP_041919862.1 RNA N6-adenosine-methyltransferase mettl16 [Alosa sapidissima]